MGRRLCWVFLLSVLAASLLLGSCGGGASNTATSPGASSLAITSNPPPDGVLQVPYNGAGRFVMMASGGVPPYTWSWAAGSGSILPPGLDVSTDTTAGVGLISGTPTALGVYNVSVTVMDSANPSMQAAAIYVINVGPPGALTISFGALPLGQSGQPYGGSHTINSVAFNGFPLAATGGVPSYTWSWAAASGSTLPPGLKLEVRLLGGSTRCCVAVPVIDGTPTTAGSYDVVLTVTDSASPKNAASATYTIVIS